MKKSLLLKDYLLSVIDFEGCGYENKENTLKNVFYTCLDEYGHIKNDYIRTKERLLGLPSIIGNVFSYYEISELMKSFGYKTQNQYKLNDMYWNNLTKFIVKSK